MAESITPHITQYYDDEEILSLIAASANLTQQF